MSVRELTEKEQLLECGRISSIAFCYSWDQEEAAKNLEKPDHRTNVTFGSFNQEGALAACLQLPEGTPADLSLEELLFKPGVVLNGNQDVLKRAFPKGAVFLNEYF